MRNYKEIVFFAIICSVFSLTHALQCMDQNNDPVDWYVLYKLPKQTAHSNNLIHEGVAYAYMTSKNSSSWTLSNVPINDTKSIPGKTLSVLYDAKKQDDLLYILYNDQPPWGSSSESKGHTKGAVLASGEQGVWLIHSVPHFPYSLKKYEYPATGVHYGQSFLCISLDLTNLNNVGLQLQYNEPHIFAQNVPKTFQTSVPELYKAADNTTIKTSPWYNVESLTSISGTKFTSFAKAGKFGKDLYADLVSTELETDLLVETWPNEANRLPSECDKKFQVDNILSIAIAEAKIVFNTTVDHSKWAVSSSKDKEHWICIGDINRAEKQTERGGGTTCLNNEKLVNKYQKIVSTIQECQNQYYYIVELN